MWSVLYTVLSTVMTVCDGLWCKCVYLCLLCHRGDANFNKLQLSMQAVNFKYRASNILLSQMRVLCIECAVHQNV